VFGQDPALVEWQRREDPDGKQLDWASRRGTAVHELLERYVELCNTTTTPANLALSGYESPHPDIPTREITVPFALIASALEPVSHIIGSEVGLFASDDMIAGTTDLICIHNGKLAILDFKSYRTSPSRAVIDKAMKQLSMYALAFYRNSGIKVEKLVIVAGNPSYGVVVQEQEYDQRQTLQLTRTIAEAVSVPTAVTVPR
jgi:ATP-dependent exoDNAse (exonuclease V) beta subunit